MNNNTNINIRMDKELKQEAELLFDDLGINMTTAINIFVKQAVRLGKIPFELATDVPNLETRLAIQEVEDMISGKREKQKTSVKELFDLIGE